jgi:hypothetical protein
MSGQSFLVLFYAVALPLIFIATWAVELWRS